MPDPHFLFVVFIILVALLFDFINGMNDAANSIATVVSTRVLSPRLAVLWAAFFNFVAAFGFGVQVATTIGKGVVDPAVVSEVMILAALIGAIVWGYLCTHYGLPISISHSLIGGLAGAAVVKAGFQALVTKGIVKVVVFIFVSPIVGMILGFIFMTVVAWIFQRSAPSKIDNWFRRLQLVSAAFYSLGHGTNDAQKTMGIIALLLFTSGYLGPTFYIPFWVILICHAAIALGTIAGGWKVIKTLGIKVTKLQPVGGFCAEAAAASTLLFTALGGIPVSTTHTITGAIMGVGSTRRLSAVRWGIVNRIVAAWILTIPASALVAALSYYFLRLFQ